MKRFQVAAILFVVSFAASCSAPPEGVIATFSGGVVTTADVAASPTADALRPHCMPRMQPHIATISPKEQPLIRPWAHCHIVIMETV